MSQTYRHSPRLINTGNHTLPAWRPRVDATGSTTNQTPDERMSLPKRTSSDDNSPASTQKGLPGHATTLQGHVSSDCYQFSFRFAFGFGFQSQNQEKSTVCRLLFAALYYITITY